MKSKQPKRRAMYLKISEVNYKFIAKEVVRTDHFINTIVEMCIESARTGKPYKLEVRESMTAKKIKAQKERRMKRYKK
jgi:hypothetical protein